MINQYRKAIEKLKVALNKLKENPNDYNFLLDLQLVIIKYHYLIERRIKNLKSLNRDAKKAQYILFILKSFGDSIAHIYIDKHNLKQLAYDLDKTTLKQSSGFISGKEGFKYELKQLKTLLKEGFPCLLCDITNSIRYGDIILLGYENPLFIECKKKNTNSSRNSRQSRRLNELATFYQTDEKKMNYGLQNVKRMELDSKPKEYLIKINDLIEKAESEGIASERIENSLYYFVIKNGDFSQEFSKYKIQKPFVFDLNEYKNHLNWIPYCPFTLSISKFQYLFEFIKGELIILVVIDIQGISKIAQKLGLHFEINEDPHYPFAFYKFGKDKAIAEAMFSISEHMITRVALEFVSLEWLITNAKNMFFREDMERK